MPVLTSQSGKNKDFFRVDLEAGDSFTIICLIVFDPAERGKPVKNRAYHLAIIALTSKLGGNTMKRIALFAVMLLITASAWNISTYDTGRSQIVLVSYCWRF